LRWWICLTEVTKLKLNPFDEDSNLQTYKLTNGQVVAQEQNPTIVSYNASAVKLYKFTTPAL
jgi:hypothetical protein